VEGSDWDGERDSQSSYIARFGKKMGARKEEKRRQKAASHTSQGKKNAWKGERD